MAPTIGSYKYCLVPTCTNTTRKCPDKYFFTVPREKALREKWCKAINRDKKPLSCNSAHYCCEDHFDIDVDVANLIQYKLIGGKLMLKEGVIPHRFPWQLKTRQVPTTKPPPPKLHSPPFMIDMEKDAVSHGIYGLQQQVPTISPPEITSVMLISPSPPSSLAGTRKDDVSHPFDGKQHLPHEQRAKKTGRYKYCLVPNCTNTNRKSPGKYFFSVPQEKKLRKQWCRAMKRDNKKPLSCVTTHYCCEDHFDMEEDVSNIMKCKLMGGTLKLKKGIIPHRFDCQKPFPKNMKTRSAVGKKQKLSTTASLESLPTETNRSHERTHTDTLPVKFVSCNDIAEPSDPFYLCELNESYNYISGNIHNEMTKTKATQENMQMKNMNKRYQIKKKRTIVNKHMHTDYTKLKNLEIDSDCESDCTPEKESERSSDISSSSVSQARVPPQKMTLKQYENKDSHTVNVELAGDLNDVSSLGTASSVKAELGEINIVYSPEETIDEEEMDSQPILFPVPVSSPGAFTEVGGSPRCSGSPFLSVIDHAELDGHMFVELENDAVDDTGSDIVEDEDLPAHGGLGIDCHWPAFFSDNIDPALEEELRRIDARSDAALGAMLPSERLVFDWRSDMNIFKGFHEVFTDIPGPTFDVSEVRSPLDMFLKIWDLDIVTKIVDQTNKYAGEYLRTRRIGPSSRLKRWIPTTVKEIYTLMALQIHQGLTPLTVEKEYFYPTCEMTAMPNFRKHINYNRWLLLKKFLHFSDNSSMTDNMTLEQKRLFKIQPITDHLNAKFQALYVPNRKINIHESLLKWHGRLSFIQKITPKATKTGLKTYELCDAENGYLWKFYIYEAKEAHTSQDNGQGTTDGQHGDDQDIPVEDTAKIVYDIVCPLLNKGRTLIMDNFYNSPILARCLKLQKTDCFGTLRLKRANVPESMRDMVKSDLQVGEAVTSTCGDLTIITWREENLVSMLSTFHRLEISDKEKYGRWKYKPQIALDYNLSMGGVEKKDQCIANFPLERCRNTVWYKKVYRREMNVSLHNAHVLYSFKGHKITSRTFRLKVAEGLLNTYNTRGPELSTTTCVKALHQLLGVACQQPRVILQNCHYLEEAPRKRCSWCLMNKIANKKTNYICDACKVPLCISCMKPYHSMVR